MHAFTLIFLTALAIHVAVQLWLAARQVRHVRANSDRVPEAFRGVISPAEHATAAQYTAARQRLAAVESLFDAGVLLWLTLGGGIAAIGRLSSALGLGPLWTGVGHLLGTFAALSLLGLPFGIYRTFVLEQRFGFNRTTPRVFVTDHLKGWALGALLGSLLAAAVLWIMRSAGARWWLLAWAVWIAFSLLLTWAWPRVIAPLFNRFSPLDDVVLRQRIDALLERCGFQASGVFVMDGSRRSAHGNAYFTGLGRQKRIVFFDTLVSTLTPAQVESVLAHELAHFKLKHVPQRLAVSAAMSFAGFAALGWLSRQVWFFTALGAGSPDDATALLLFVFVVPVFLWVISPIAAAWSRRHEFEADAFAARHSDGHELASALVSMYKENASTLTPDPLYSAFHDSHPSPAARIARLKSTGHPGCLAPAPATA